MKPNFRFLSPGFLVFTLLSSCSTYISFEKSAPPEIEIAENKNTIAFINSFDYTKLTYTNEKKIDLYINGIGRIIEGLSIAFSKDPGMDFLVADTLVKGHANNTFAYITHADSVKATCKMAKTSLLLALEAFDIYFDQETEVEENDDGSKSRTAYFTLAVNAGFSLYDSTGKLIDRIMIKEPMPYSSRPVVTSLFAIQPSLSKAGPDVEILAVNAGKDYVNRFYPGSEMVTRKIFYGKDLFTAYIYIMNRDWHEAIKALMPLTESSNPRTSKKAAHNLSVVHEASDNPTQSEYWQKISNQK